MMIKPSFISSLIGVDNLINFNWIEVHISFTTFDGSLGVSAKCVS